MKQFLLILSTYIALFGLENLLPTKTFVANGSIQSIAIQNGKLYAGTDTGEINIFDIGSKKIIKTIKIPPVKDFIGDKIQAKIYSVDVLDDAVLIVSQGEKSYRNLYIYKNDNLKSIINSDKKMFIKKANFVSKDKIIFALLNNQLGLYDIQKNQQIYLNQLSASSFSYFMLSEDKKTLATTDESGVVRILNTATGKIEKELKAINLDKIYQLDYKQGTVLTAGQDRKAVLYKDGNIKTLDFNFLLYSCALSQKANLGAIAYNENNDVLIFDTTSKKYLYNLIGQEATMTQILFGSENELFVSSESKKINYFKIGKKQ